MTGAGANNISLANISALSLDVYGTLLNLQAVAEAVVSRLFYLAGVDDPDGSGGRRLWREVSLDMFRQFRELEGAGAGSGPGRASGFRTIRAMFEAAYSRVLPRLGLSRVAPRQAASVLLEAHTQAPAFPDILPFLRQVTPSLTPCVASDADLDILDPALSNASLAPYLPLRVCSEGVGSYKVEPGGPFFPTVLDLLGCAPDQVAHVGDGESDVVGAKQAGLVAVWVSRSGRPWAREDHRPDVVVTGFDELARLLPLEAVSGAAEITP